MKTLWVDIRPWNKNLMTTALESGADAVFLPDGFSEKARELGKIKVIAGDGDLKPGKDVVEIDIKSKADEEKAAKLSLGTPVIVKTSDWTIIPLENLIAHNNNIIAAVQSSEEAKTALQILEKGVKGILLKTDDPSEIKKTAKLVNQSTEAFGLIEAEITNVKTLGMGDRVCIDTCTNMKQGQGMLIGNSSSAMFLIHSESIDNPYVASRPFRVNAGAVHAYIRVLNDKTKYLSEIKSGDEVLIVNHDGVAEPAVVGRAKVEKRPLMLIEASVKNEKSGENKKTFSVILQNAETIRLVRPGGEPISVVALKPGDVVLSFIEGFARHFGMKIEETIQEK